MLCVLYLYSHHRQSVTVNDDSAKCTPINIDRNYYAPQFSWLEYYYYILIESYVVCVFVLSTTDRHGFISTFIMSASAAFFLLTNSWPKVQLTPELQLRPSIHWLICGRKEMLHTSLVYCICRSRVRLYLTLYKTEFWSLVHYIKQHY